MPQLRLPPALILPDDDQALTLLMTYYARDPIAPAGIAYTGALFDTWAKHATGGADPAPDRFTADDLVAITFLSVQVPPRAAALLLDQQAEQYSQLLASIGPDRDLVEVADGEITQSWPAWQLHHSLRALPGVDWVIASKLLARKRPRLVPVYDRVVRDVVGHPDKFWGALHAALRHNDQALHRRLLGLRAQAGLPRQVSALRVFDVVAWMGPR